LEKVSKNCGEFEKSMATQVVRVMPDFKAVVFVEGQLPFNVANAFDAVNSAFDGQ
jgi:hypothetical protein